MLTHSDVPYDTRVAGVVGSASDATPRRNFAVWLLCSAVLHGLVLLLFFLTVEPQSGSYFFPVDIVVLADRSVGPPQPDTASEPRQKGGQPSTPAAEPVGVSPAKAHPDDLDIKLHALAKLRQPSVDTHLAEKDIGLSRRSAMSNDAASASFAIYAVRDFIRSQVERRWSLDLPTLDNSNYSVLIRVEMTKAGVVTKAEIADIARFNSDTTYRAIALSARNAVLLSSPFALPPGPYSDVMDFTLSLNTKEAMR